MDHNYLLEQAAFSSINLKLDLEEIIVLSNGYSYVVNNSLTSIDTSKEISIKKIQYCLTCTGI